MTSLGSLTQNRRNGIHFLFRKIFAFWDTYEGRWVVRRV